MGRDITQSYYGIDDFRRFQCTLYNQLDQLKLILKNSEFGNEPLRFGAELEFYIVNQDGEVSLSNNSLLDGLADPQFQPELNQYNIELNLSAVPQFGKPFTALNIELTSKLAFLQSLAKQNSVNVLPIGILPTLKAKHLTESNMTDTLRYKCLSKHLYQKRGKAFKIEIDGEEPLSINFNDICAEGANTSFQVHMMTPHDRFTDIYNAAQLTLPIVTAISGNSPIFLGNKLWDETRIALFKQSLDIRDKEQFSYQEHTRVNFGTGWLKNSVWDLFAESVALHEPIIPEVFTEETNEGLPKLDELNLHMGTLWPWHRPVYDHHGNGHMRIEFRAIPAGPTNIDMLANAAFSIGLAQGISKNIDQYIAVMPFRYAEYNFYRAAQHGLNAKILWPYENKYKLQETTVTDVITRLLPFAKDGLKELGIDQDEIDFFIGIIKSRLKSGVTGAVWQKQTLRYYETFLTKEQACKKLVLQYLTNFKSCKPVTEWLRPWA